jgi:hypothetical protein
MSDNSSNQNYDGSGVEKSPRLDTDISGMDPVAAQEYVVSFITALKTTQKQRQGLEEEKKLWQERVALAQAKQQAELAAQAQNRVTEIQAKITGLEAEERELERKVVILKTELQKMAGKPAMSVDADRLLADLEMIVGEPDKTREAFKEEETNAELQKLKDRLNREKEKP